MSPAQVQILQELTFCRARGDWADAGLVAQRLENRHPRERFPDRSISSQLVHLAAHMLVERVSRPGRSRRYWVITDHGRDMLVAYKHARR